MANYDPMAALDFEKRFGIKNGDIDDFIRKVFYNYFIMGRVDPRRERRAA